MHPQSAWEGPRLRSAVLRHTEGQEQAQAQIALPPVALRHPGQWHQCLHLSLCHWSAAVACDHKQELEPLQAPVLEPPLVQELERPFAQRAPCQQRRSESGPGRPGWPAS